jgi:hypothetical protein
MMLSEAEVLILQQHIQQGLPAIHAPTGKDGHNHPEGESHVDNICLVDISLQVQGNPGKQVRRSESQDDRRWNKTEFE